MAGWPDLRRHHHWPPLGQSLLCDWAVHVPAVWEAGHQPCRVTGADDIGTGALGMLGNVLWFIFAGIWLAIGHVVTAIGCFVTIIGIPFGIQHVKLAVLALAPVGKTIVTNEVADAARLYSAQMHVTGNRG